MADIKKAAAAIKGRVVETPCLHSRTLSEITGARVYLKFENHQFTASFKERGALNKLLSLTKDQAAKGVIAVSAGNHAQGVAYHAHRLGIPAVMVMPQFTPNVKVEHTARHGAEVILHGADFDEAKDLMRSLAVERGLTIVHPYDDEMIIAGQGTAGLEMLEAHPDIDTLAIAIGGGGLISGISIAAKAINPGIEVIGVETERYPSMLHALEGTRAEFGLSTIAEGIAVKEAGMITREIVRKQRLRHPARGRGRHRAGHRPAARDREDRRRRRGGRLARGHAPATRRGSGGKRSASCCAAATSTR